MGEFQEKILLVDDERNIREIYASLLADQGYFTAGAASASEALARIGEERFDIVFVDHFLGSDRGLDLIPAMAARDPRLSFVMFTANGNTDLAVEALKRGASDYITKPFTVAELLKSIDYVKRKRALDEERRSLEDTLRRTVEQKTEELSTIHLSVLSTLAQTVEKKDQGTYGHSRRVAHYAMLIAAAIDLPESERNTLRDAAMLHDIGKIGITDLVIGKKGPLTSAERDLIRSHPQKGFEILRPIKQFERFLPVVLHHHEHYDGSGYPYGLAGENIPLLARIVTIADAYDAMVSNRPYRSGGSHERALEELTAYAGKQFDPRIVEVFTVADSRYRHMFNLSGSAFQL